MICRLRSILISALAVLSFSFPNVASAELGYKDLLIGMPTTDILKHCKAIPSKYYSEEFKCYGLNDVTFFFKTMVNDRTAYVQYLQYDKTLMHNLKSLIGTDLVQIMVRFGTYNLLQNLLGSGDDTPYVNLKERFNKKYQRDYDYGEREKELFLNGDAEHLVTSYEAGQVLLSIRRLKDGKIIYEVVYAAQWLGEVFYDYYKPKNADLDDF